MIHFILYVQNQERSKIFYSAVLECAPVLDVPGMTEFVLQENCKLGLMPEKGIQKILGDMMPDPSKGQGIPRCELYLPTENITEAVARCLTAGAILVDDVKARNWGDTVAYVADPDGHIIAWYQK